MPVSFLSRLHFSSSHAEPGRCPQHVTSIGLGGGSRVQTDPETGKVSVGPTSVGYQILDEALVFGGSTLVATDIAVASRARPISDVGDASKVAHLDPALVTAVEARMKSMLEVVCDSMKTSTGDVPVYLVGGGAILVPDELSGVSKVQRLSPSSLSLTSP